MGFGLDGRYGQHALCHVEVGHNTGQEHVLTLLRSTMGIIALSMAHLKERTKIATLQTAVSKDNP